MKHTTIAGLSVVLLTMLVARTGSAAGKHATVKGYVIDSSCTFTKDLKKPISPDCAVACAKAGSPLVIQAVNGAIYLPISGDQPASGQNDKLMPFAGQKVTVTGTVYDKGGSHAIVIDKIEGAPKP
jgi:type 1 fimbria pilin